MSLKTTVQKALWNWLSEETGLATIWFNQDGPRPARPYAMLSMITGPAMAGATDELVHVDGDNYKTRGHRTLTVQVDIFGQDAMQILTDARDSLEDPTVVDTLSELSTAVLENGTPRDLSGMRDTGWESRASMDMLVGTTSERETALGYINETETSGSYSE